MSCRPIHQSDPISLGCVSQEMLNWSNIPFQKGLPRGTSGRHLSSSGPELPVFIVRLQTQSHLLLACCFCHRVRVNISLDSLNWFSLATPLAMTCNCSNGSHVFCHWHPVYNIYNTANARVHLHFVCSFCDIYWLSRHLFSWHSLRLPLEDIWRSSWSVVVFLSAGSWFDRPLVLKVDVCDKQLYISMFTMEFPRALSLSHPGK